MKSNTLLCLIALFVFGTPVKHAQAFGLSPKGTALEQSVAKKYSNWWRRVVSKLTEQGLHHFSESVHEEITNRMFGCTGDSDVCGNPDVGYATSYVIAGVRWNDDPPFRLEAGEGSNTSCKIEETIRFTTQPKCWFELFEDAKKKATEGTALDANSRASLLGRSHFGDLQFLHAMAAADGEEAYVTKRKIMMWAEFVWRVSTGEYELSTKLSDLKIDGMSNFFGKTAWTVQDLFTLGNPPLRPRIKEVAFGSLLHMVQDSFAKGHASRAEAISGQKCEGAKEHAAPGKILEFHAYNHQDSDEHAKYDSRNAFSSHWSTEKPNVIDVGQVIVDYYNPNKTTWEQARPYLDCVFTLENPSARASAGNGFSKKHR